MITRKKKWLGKIPRLFAAVFAIGLATFIGAKSVDSIDIHAMETVEYKAKNYDNGALFEGYAEWYYPDKTPTTYTYDWFWMVRTDIADNGTQTYEIQVGQSGTGYYANKYAWAYPFKVTVSTGYEAMIYPSTKTKYSYSGTKCYYNSAETKIKLEPGKAYTVTVECTNGDGKTYSKGTLSVLIPHVSHDVTQSYYYWDEYSGKWVNFKNSTTKVNHGSTFTPTNVSSPTGYSPGNNFGVYNSSGVHLSDGTVGRTSVQITQNVNIHIHYYANSYTVKYNGNGGTWNNTSSWSNTAKYGANYWIQTGFFTRPGYTFTGWSGSDGNWYSPGSTVRYWRTSGLTLTANWQPITYSITYTANGGTGANQTQYVNYGSSYVTRSNMFSRPGYAFMGWNERANGTGYDNTPYIGQNRTWTWTYNLTLYAQWNAIPTLNLKDFYVIEGQEFLASNLINGVGYDKDPTSEFPDKLKSVTYKATANDKENGDISSRISVVSVKGPSGETLTNINTNKVGTYTVTYKVTDLNGISATGTRKIIVLPSSTPEILAGDRYFYKGDEITKENLLARIKATDKYDGVITSKVEIVHFDNINSSIVGDYEVTYRVTNTSNKTTEKTVVIHILDLMENQTDDSRVRFISGDYVDTLSAGSKWSTNAELNTLLINSMNKNSSEEAVRVYKFSAEEIEDVKEDIKNNGF